jgi:penicillin G amidase
MRRTSIFVFGAVLLVAACSKDPHALDVVVRKAAFNQGQIQIRSAPPGTADRWLAFHQGYLQAQDRFLQMDLQRRVGRGRLAEIFGEKAVESDRKAVGVGLAHAVLLKTEYLRNAFPEEHELLVAFSEGVNKFLSEMPTLAHDQLKNYRQITGDARYLPAPWEPADSVAVAQNVSFYLSSNLQQKLMMGQISVAISGKGDPTSSKLSTALDFRPIFDQFILDADQKQNRWRERAKKQTASARERSVGRPLSDAVPAFPSLPVFGCIENPFPFPECGRKASFGSNNWVVSPQVTGSDTTFLANDPHLRMTFPMTFYEGAYDSTPAGGTLKVRGFGLVGVPGVLIGHNQSIGWGMTNLGADVDDVYLELLDAETHSKVWTVNPETKEEEYVPLEFREFTLKVRNARGGIDERPFMLRWVKHHGPVFSDHIPEIQKVLDEYSHSHPHRFHVVASYRWTGHDASSEYAALIGLNRAKNPEQAKASLKAFGAGAQNIVYADTSGNFGYYAHGRFPVRPYVSVTQGPFVPVIPYMRHVMNKIAPAWLGGSSETAEWDGYRSEVPELTNPASGRVITANNDPFGHSQKTRLSEFEDYFGYGFSTGVRAQRITELLDAASGRMDLEVMKSIQTDHKDLFAEKMIELMRANRASLKLSKEGETLLEKLLSWDFEMDASQNAPLLADTFIGKLSSTFLDASAPQISAVLREHIDRTAFMGKTVYHRLREGLNSEMGNRRETALGILSTAVDRAAAEVGEKKLEKVKWGEVHRVQFYNPLPGVIPSMISYPIERDGSWETVDVSGDSYGPNFRMILSIQPGKPIQAITSVPGGNYSVFDKDSITVEIRRWRDGKYRDLVPFIE